MGGPSNLSLHPGTYLWQIEAAGQRRQWQTGGILESFLEMARALAGGKAVEVSSLECITGRSPLGETQQGARKTDEHSWAAQISERTGCGWSVIASAGIRAIDQARLAEPAAGADAVEFAFGSGSVGSTIADALEAEARRWLGADCRLKRASSIVIDTSMTARRGRLTSLLTREGVEAAVDLFADDGTRVGSVRGALMAPSDPAKAAAECLHELAWEPVQV